MDKGISFFVFCVPYYFNFICFFFLCSCDKVKWLEEKKFWQFEGMMLLVAFFSTAVVHLRQKILDHRMLRRIQRQIANSV